MRLYCKVVFKDKDACVHGLAIQLTSPIYGPKLWPIKYGHDKAGPIFFWSRLL